MTMKIFLGLNGHANTASLPLRLGIQITEKHQQFPTLESATFDECGTSTQRVNEINDGRKHYFGTLAIKAVDPLSPVIHRLECRVVLASPRNANDLPAVITILQKCDNKGDMTVTRHLEKMMKKGRIKVSDIIAYFHPAYVNGEILDSTDCDDIYQRMIVTNAPPLRPDDPTITAIIQDPAPVIAAMEANSVDEVDLRAPLTYEKLSIKGVKYDYVLADAFITNVWMNGDVIHLTCINSKGAVQELHSFKPKSHLAEHHKYTFDYLTERVDQRALFAICNSQPCRGFIAETVTSIALQLMRSGTGLPTTTPVEF